MSIRIQRCHPQVHATHIDFTVTHSLKRFPEAKSLSFSSDDDLSLTPSTSHVGNMRCRRPRCTAAAEIVSRASHGAYLGARLPRTAPPMCSHQAIEPREEGS